MQKKTQKELISLLKLKEDFHFAEFQLIHEGNYKISDADWNYKDVPHLTHIHQLVEGYCGYMGHDVNCVIIVQKMFGMKFPATLSIYESGEKRQTYFMALFWFVLIVETIYEPLGDDRTRVITSYAIGTKHRFLKLFFPLAKLALKRNYANLMSGDIPMRERRGELRSWGYSFKGDNKPYGFYETTLINRSNVCAPNIESEFVIHQFRWNDLQRTGELLLGRSDQFGISIRCDNNKLNFFPRLCPHEGADLSSQCNGDKVRCPWHGRLFNPILSIETASLVAPFQIDNGKLNFMLDNNIATIEVRRSII